MGGGHGQVEGAGAGDVGGPREGAGPAGEAAGLLGRAPQVGPGGGREPSVEGVERTASPDGGQGGGQRPFLGGGVVDVVRGHDVDAGAGGQGGQGVVAG